MADKTYDVLNGIDFPPHQRREVGETVKESELPKGSVKRLVERGDIRPQTKKEKDD